jgi:hypothetical protein
VTLEQLGNLGDLIGGIAVVASLLYVAVQLRQNTRITRSAVRQSIAARASDLQLSVAQNNDILAAVAKLFQGKEMSPEESIRLHFFLGGLFRATEEAFLQHREGFLEDEYWNTRARLMINYLRYPGMFEAWKERLRSVYHPAFVEWIEREFTKDAA